MKGWLARAQANTVLRGERGPRVARWSRWFRRSGPVPDDRFQGPDEPFPRHWREFPHEWPPEAAAPGAIEHHLRDALHRLPATWRAAVIRRDVAGRSDSNVASELGLTDAQERNVVARARAALHDELDELLNPGTGR